MADSSPTIPVAPSGGTPPTPIWARAGLVALVAADPRLACIEAISGPLPWRLREPGFPGLLRAICGQQISNQAASAIWRRLGAIPGALVPATLITLDDATLCGIGGLSRPKAAHARALAAACLDGTLDFAALAALPDDAAIARLVTVRGLGRWTAEVHLLFAEQRPDIVPSGDLALAGATADLLRLPARPTPRELAPLAAGWAPWRSLAARLLWHHWRHVTGRSTVEDL